MEQPDGIVDLSRHRSFSLSSPDGFPVRPARFTTSTTAAVGRCSSSTAILPGASCNERSWSG